jgi:hypothetical protein
MRAPAETRATIANVVDALASIDGDVALDYLEELLDVLKLVAKTESLEQRAKSQREAAAYAELWIDNTLETVKAIRKVRQG